MLGSFKPKGPKVGGGIYACLALGYRVEQLKVNHFFFEQNLSTCVQVD